jgi:hypothetical protein
LRFLHQATCGYSSLCSILNGFNFGSDANVLNVTYLGVLATLSDFTGDVPFNGRVVYSPEGRCSITVPHHQLTCTTSPGGGRGLTWLPVVDGQAAVAPSTAYAPPIVSGVTLLKGSGWGGGVSTGGLPRANCDGGDSAVLTGTNFGPAALLQRVRYGATGIEYSASTWTWLNDSALLVGLAPGIGKVCTCRNALCPRRGVIV